MHLGYCRHVNRAASCFTAAVHEGFSKHQLSPAVRMPTLSPSDLLSRGAIAFALFQHSWPPLLQPGRELPSSFLPCNLSLRGKSGEKFFLKGLLEPVLDKRNVFSGWTLHNAE